MKTYLIAFLARTTMKTSMISGSYPRVIRVRVLGIPDCPKHLLTCFEMP
jgi:hypothetical protein